MPEIPQGRGTFSQSLDRVIEPCRALVLGGKGEGFQWVWQFGLYPIDKNRTRLLTGSVLFTWLFNATGGSVFVFEDSTRLVRLPNAAA